ncbi:hypothetical protein [Cellulophaga sp. L1A9]|uniref:hypothetical protein n=1 Tax=Cellulophaga sp. L1A9 TaxID=2686362 RepID=UPI00131AADC6|nr:hypothetical protein [Cellulophaga sp. L1A9]
MCKNIIALVILSLIQFLANSYIDDCSCSEPQSYDQSFTNANVTNITNNYTDANHDNYQISINEYRESYHFKLNNILINLTKTHGIPYSVLFKITAILASENTIRPQMRMSTFNNRIP